LGLILYQASAIFALLVDEEGGAQDAHVLPAVIDFSVHTSNASATA